MERDLPMRFCNGDCSGEFLPSLVDQTSDGSGLDAMFSGISLQGLLTLSTTPEKALLPFPEYSAIGTSQIGFPAPLGFAADDSLSYFQAQQLEQTLVAGEDHQRPGPGAIDCDRKKMKMPKEEPMNKDDVVDESRQPFNFIFNGSDLMSSKLISNSSSFHHLPSLHSLDELASTERDDRVADNFWLAESSNKRVRTYSPSQSDAYTLDAIVRGFRLTNCLSPYNSGDAPAPAPAPARPAVIPHSRLARQRRQRIGDKTRCLQKLLPWDKKMDTATMFEEVYKYIKFLEAQMRVLQSMPCECDKSSFALQNPRNNDAVAHAGFGGLGRLNRQQLLQVLVNSPVAQTTMYSHGSCVFSVEQLAMLKEMRRVYAQRALFDPSKL
ncbi:uncharacterized protein LOC131150197 [Malania oleifera]|uniref:uncharacterized protein LOC131150197 n=1 Tax=Malania oleifera TaxID=397392 RepID=UPI0025ADD532|nr:uncharacterized protein LOC131150197 [Malania oleifera]